MTWLRTAAIGCGLLALMLAAGGCGGFSRAGQSFWRQATVGGPRVVEVLEHYRQASRLTPEQIDEEIGRLRAAWHREQSAETLFQLVALAMQPDRPVVDRRLALNLLTEYQQRAGERDDLLALAGLLADQTRALLRRTDELAEARGRAAGLKEKLRALENIEKILRRREEGLSPGAEEKIRP